jgi:CDP-diglyceride synthetase
MAEQASVAAMIEALCMIVWANGAPVLARLLLGERWDSPVDGGLLYRDGRRWLGASKTWRGWVICALTTPLVAWLFEISWEVGLLVAILAMLGDAVSSFVKRRLGYPTSTSVMLLDQVPESLMPAIALLAPLGLTLAEIGLSVAGFVIIDILLTPLVIDRRRRSHSPH